MDDGFFAVTGKDGFRHLIGRAWVMDVTDDPALVKMHGGPPGQCLIVLSGAHLLVQETYDEIMARLLPE